MGNMAKAEGSNYDLYTFVTHGVPSGVSLGSGACNSDPSKRISYSIAHGPGQCNRNSPPKPIDCSKLTNRIALTAQVSMH